MATPSPSRPGRPKPPPPTLVLLVRHGATPTTGKVLPGRAAGLHLAESGREQADAVAARIQAWATAGAHSPRRRRGARSRAGSTTTTTDAPAVYASPLERTRETAAPIAKALGQRVSVNRGLLECDFGEWTGAELKDLARKPEWSAVQRYPSGFRFPGGESFTAMQARIVDTVATLVSRHRGGTVIVVSHADPIKAVVADALGTHLDLFQRIVVSPCSVTAISYAPTGPTVLAVNSTGTLSELQPS
jgi:probable phosphoglycerate mutase